MVMRTWVGGTGRGMKYFTKDWFSGDLSEATVDERVEKYNQYLDEIFEALPFTLKVLFRSISLHDAIIEKVVYDEERKTATFHLLCGDRQVGYFALIIEYLNASKLDSSLFEENTLEILRDELEWLKNENKYSHKLFFSDKSETEIVFEDISLQLSTKGPLDYKRVISSLPRHHQKKI